MNCKFQYSIKWLLVVSFIACVTVLGIANYLKSFRKGAFTRVIKTGVPIVDDDRSYPYRWFNTYCDEDRARLIIFGDWENLSRAKQLERASGSFDVVIDGQLVVPADFTIVLIKPDRFLRYNKRFENISMHMRGPFTHRQPNNLFIESVLSESELRVAMRETQVID